MYIGLVITNSFVVTADQGCKDKKNSEELIEERRRRHRESDAEAVEGWRMGRGCPFLVDGISGASYGVPMASNAFMSDTHFLNVTKSLLVKKKNPVI